MGSSDEPAQLGASVTTAKVGENAYVLSLLGELDLSSTPRFVAELEALTPDGPEIVLDLSDVSLIDSTALGAILVAARRLRQADGAMALVSTSPTTTKLLSTVGVDRVVPVYETADRALEHLIGSIVLRRLER